MPVISNVGAIDMNGYYFQIPKAEVRKIIGQSAIMFAVIIIILSFLTGKDHSSAAIVLALVHVGGYVYIGHYKYVYVSQEGIRGDSPFFGSKVLAWEYELEIKPRYNNQGIRGYSLQRSGFPDSIFVPAAIFATQQFKNAVAEFAPPNHVLLNQQL